MATLLQSGARLSPSVAILGDIHDCHCNLAIWERPPIPGLDALVEGARRDLRFSTDCDTLTPKLTNELAQAGYAASPLLDALIDDIGELANRFGDLASARRIELRLEVVTTDSCRKFHGDYVTARLITTYAGRGTQWLDHSDAARVRKGIEPRNIRTLQTGDVGIFKGKMATDQPAIHRSPPIAGTGEKRLLLVINPGK